jgi:hypothetical protein
MGGVGQHRAHLSLQLATENLTSMPYGCRYTSGSTEKLPFTAIAFDDGPRQDRCHEANEEGQHDTVLQYRGCHHG